MTSKMQRWFFPLKILQPNPGDVASPSTVASEEEVMFENFVSTPSVKGMLVGKIRWYILRYIYTYNLLEITGKNTKIAVCFFYFQFCLTKTCLSSLASLFLRHFWVARMDITVSVQIMWKVALLGILACKNLMFRKKTSKQNKNLSSHQHKSQIW